MKEIIEQKGLVEEGKFEITPVGLRVIRNMEFEEWEQLGKYLILIRKAIHWLAGDWCRYGDSAFGEQYSQALDSTGFDYQTLANDVWVTSKFPLERRRAALSFGIHAELASLEPAEQERWLDYAEKNDTTVSELRKLLKDEVVKEEELVRVAARMVNNDDTEQSIPIYTISKSEYEKVISKLERIDRGG